MNKLIKKIACALMALSLITGIFTGCGVKKTELPDYTSVKEESGDLPVKGKVGDLDYKILSKEQFGCYNKDRGYYFDQLEQLNSPLFIVISAGTQTRKGGELRITDLGMQGSKLVIVVEETKAKGDKYTGLDCPCAVLELDHAPGELLIVSTKGEQFNHIKP